MIVRPEHGSHWYLPDGKPYYEVPNASKPGTMRKATIADAEKAGAVPSVTTILRTIAKPGLDAWKLETAVLSALTLPRLPGEDTDAFAVRVVQDMDAQSEKARQTGTNLHDAIEDWIATGSVPLGTSPEAAAVDAYRAWHKANVKSVIASEKSFACGEYGGRVDLVADLATDGVVVIDFKTQATKKGKFTTYPEWLLQLVAYSDGMGYPNASLFNIVFSTMEPGLYEVHDWTPDREAGRKAWAHTVGLWQYLNKWGSRSK